MPTVNVAIPIDESVLEQVDALARQMRASRKQVIVEAIEHFVKRHENRELQQRLDDVYSDEPSLAERERLSGMKHLHRKVVEGEW